MRAMFEFRVAKVFLCAGALALTAGCASSSKQTESSQAKSTSSQKARSGEKSEGSGGKTGAEQSGEAADEPDRDPVKLASVIGADTAETLPGGCPGEWEELEGRDYEGTKYACEGFRVATRYKKPTVMIGVKENQVRRITLQAFYDKGEPIESAYSEVTDMYGKRCDAESASGSAMSFLCDDYVVQVSHRKRTGSLRIVLGLENWDMP